MNYSPNIYKHVKRPEWGLSTIVTTEDDSTTFLFDDGRRRIIKVGYLHLMHAVALLDEAAEEVHRKLAKHRRRVKAGAARKRP